MHGRLKIIVPSFNSVKYLPKTLHSIEMQTVKDIDVCVVDDCSTLPQQRVIIEEFCRRNRWSFIFHTCNQGALVSIKDGIESMQCQDDDVIVIIDGDDWLSDDQVFKTLQEVYAAPEVYLTYGSFETYPKNCINITYAAPVSPEVIEKQLYRQTPWIYHHLKTFRFRLWKHLKDKDLRNAQGDYYMVTSDRAIFYPLLELAGHHIRHIDRILYIYNVENPLNDHKISRDEQFLEEQYIKAQPSYPPLP
ncbi:putative glycosyl transferase family 2 protein [Candidatus Protochlamydia naegleriophila]|uniref:Putative glycosyl transferase family 2 protein n=1 Tax=Candidatus Protochlamydia naegleriophila TaxID=389348 RepID=A0A0U5JD39_9BACT|nr:glycosyltransferase family A protein [Candidatus Protochlamydia naegleriophila]CUI17021.1 putative glycosyl transferase family 2 protein [Candidatus Protochlamydia naegleriophila]